MVTSLDAVSILWCGMENGGSKFLVYLKQIYAERFGLGLEVERTVRGMRVTIVIGYLPSPASLSAANLLQKKLEKDSKLFSVGFEMDGVRVLRGWWIVGDPVSIIQMLASFVGVTCSDAEARLVWIGL